MKHEESKNTVQHHEKRIREMLDGFRVREMEGPALSNKEREKGLEEIRQHLVAMESLDPQYSKEFMAKLATEFQVTPANCQLNEVKSPKGLILYVVWIVCISALYILLRYCLQQ